MQAAVGVPFERVQMSTAWSGHVAYLACRRGANERSFERVQIDRRLGWTTMVDVAPVRVQSAERSAAVRESLVEQVQPTCFWLAQVRSTRYPWRGENSFERVQTESRVRV
jgi:hypothetical protein